MRGCRRTSPAPIIQSGGRGSRGRGSGKAPLADWHRGLRFGSAKGKEARSGRGNVVDECSSWRDRQVAGVGTGVEVRGARRRSWERSAGGIPEQKVGIFTPYKYGSPGPEIGVGGDGHILLKSINVWTCTAVWRKQKATARSRHPERWSLRLSEIKYILWTRKHYAHFPES